MTLNDDKTAMAHILRVARDGVGKDRSCNNCHHYHNQIRISAELVEKGLLRYIEPRRIYITTDKGIIYLKSIHNYG